MKVKDKKVQDCGELGQTLQILAEKREKTIGKCRKQGSLSSNTD